MFEIMRSDVKSVLSDYGISAEIEDIIELQRYCILTSMPSSTLSGVRISAGKKTAS